MFTHERTGTEVCVFHTSKKVQMLCEVVSHWEKPNQTW